MHPQSIHNFITFGRGVHGKEEKNNECPQPAPADLWLGRRLLQRLHLRGLRQRLVPGCAQQTRQRLDEGRRGVAARHLPAP